MVSGRTISSRTLWYHIWFILEVSVVAHVCRSAHGVTLLSQVVSGTVVTDVRHAVPGANTRWLLLVAACYNVPAAVQ
jgi:hypothetical protein